MAAAWVATGPALDWDEANTTKLAKHNLTSEEVTSLFHSKVVLLGQIIEPEQEEPRWIALGLTATSRHVTLVFTRRGDCLRPISCRAMRRNERRLYEGSSEDAGEG